MKKIEKPSKEFIESEKDLFKIFKEMLGIQKTGKTLIVPEGISESSMKKIQGMAKKAGLTVKVKAHKLKKEWTK